MTNALVALRPVKSRPQKILFRVTGNDRVPFALIPYNAASVALCGARRYRKGDIVGAAISKPRHPGQWRLAHALGQMLVDQHEDFELLDAHGALKAIQVKAGLACDFIQLGEEVLKIPQSLSYESIDQGVFNQVFIGMCRWISENIWPELTTEQVAKQAEMLACD